MEKADVYMALGLEMPGGKPEVADPGSAVQPEGENVQAVAGSASESGGNESLPPVEAQAGAGEQIATSAPPPRNDRNEGADGGTGNPAATGADAEDSSASPQNDRVEMSKEERARQAKLRRERELNAAVEAARAEERQKADQNTAALLKEMGITNRYRDDAPITTQAELDQWRQDQRDAKLQQRLKSGQLTQEDLQAAASASPTVQELRQQVEQLQQKEQARQRTAQEEQIQRELAKIHELDPSVSSIADVLALDTGAEFSRLVQERGMRFDEAFILANQARLQKTQQLLGQEAAARNRHSKDHLQAVGARQGKVVQISKATMEAYRTFRPDLTDEEIRQDYARRHQ